MKKYSTFFAIAVAILVLASCSVTRPRRVETLFIDFRPYTETGFYLSPNPYTLPHDILGELNINVYPAVLKQGANNGFYPQGGEKRRFVDGTYTKSDPQTSGAAEETISSDELLEIAVSHAKSLGADGISDLKVSSIYHTHIVGRSVYSVFDHYQISGSCIVRK